VTIPADTEVTLRLVNEGVAAHNLSIEGTGIESPMVGSGETYELVVNLPPGDYVIVCEVPGHRLGGMTGILHVVE
jgi:uncharacterized cupredoxin-like copper-binding protein